METSKYLAAAVFAAVSVGVDWVCAIGAFIADFKKPITIHIPCIYIHPEKNVSTKPCSFQLLSYLLVVPPPTEDSGWSAVQSRRAEFRVVKRNVGAVVAHAILDLGSSKLGRCAS